MPPGRAGGGSVVLSVARYFTAGTLVIPAGVVLCGPTEGPSNPYINPASATVAATLLITNTSNTPFITLQGIGAGVTGVYWPGGGTGGNWRFFTPEN